MTTKHIQFGVLCKQGDPVIVNMGHITDDEVNTQLSNIKASLERGNPMLIGNYVFSAGFVLCVEASEVEEADG